MNEAFKRMLSDKDEKILHLKSHHETLEDHIRKSKNVEESPYRSDIDLEKEIKRLNKLIANKGNELVQIHRKLENQEPNIC